MVLCVCLCVTHFAMILLSKRPSSYCLIHFGGSSGAAHGQLMGSSGVARRRKTTFDERRPSMEDDLQWKMTFDGKRHMMEDNK